MDKVTPTLWRDRMLCKTLHSVSSHHPKTLFTVDFWMKTQVRHDSASAVPCEINPYFRRLEPLVSAVTICDTHFRRSQISAWERFVPPSVTNWCYYWHPGSPQCNRWDNASSHRVIHRQTFVQNGWSYRSL